MQGGKKMYRCRRGISAGLFAVLMVSAVRSSSQGLEHIHAWDRGTAGASARLCAPLLAYGRRSEGSGLLASHCRPYGIDGLDAILIEAFHRDEAFCTHMEWGALDHPIYREDRFVFGFAVSLCPGKVFIGQTAELLRQGVKGTAPMTVYRSASTVLLNISCNAVINIDLYNISNSHPTSYTLHMLLDLASIDLLFGCSGERIRISDPRIGARLKISTRVFLLIGFRVATDEICAGVMMIGGKTVAGFGWGSHPVLGETYSAGLGRMWQR